jgi:hypothetical protein
MKVAYTSHWDERYAPVCEKHNYKGYLCQGCYEEKIQGMAALLSDCVRALNELPNTTLHGKYKDTYSLCSAIDQTIKNPL